MLKSPTPRRSALESWAGQTSKIRASRSCWLLIVECATSAASEVLSRSVSIDTVEKHPRQLVVPVVAFACTISPTLRLAACMDGLQDVTDPKFCHGMELMEKYDLIYDALGDLTKLKAVARK